MLHVMSVLIQLKETTQENKKCLLNKKSNIVIARLVSYHFMLCLLYMIELRDGGLVCVAHGRVVLNVLCLGICVRVC